VDGSFENAEFYHPQGLTHYLSDKDEHCLMVCDTKNHLIREVNLNKREVRTVSGQTRVRGFDRKGGVKPARE